MRKLPKFSFLITLFLALMYQTVFSQSDDILFRKHIVHSGFNGLFYGFAFDYIFNITGGAAAGLPVITAGTCAVVPLLTNSSKQMTSNRLLLTSHGQSIGWAHGFALACIMQGNAAFDNDAKAKFTTGLAAAGSIGLGILGNHLAKTKDWSEGRVALYRHYGWVGPFTGFSLASAFSSDARVFGTAILIGGAGGYLLADKVNKWHEFTRGEVRATQVLTAFNIGLGYCIFADSDPSFNDNLNSTGWLYPAIGAISGTLIGHLWLKDSKLTLSQGMTTAYAAGGGAVIGLGIALITKSDKFTPYYAIPYITGIGAYAIAVQMLKKKNSTQAMLPFEKSNNWDFAFMPQNLYMNKLIQQRGFKLYGRQVGMQPLFAATLRF